MYDQPVM